LLRELFRLVRRPESVDFLFQDCNLFCVVFSFVHFEHRDIHHHREHERERVKEVITYMRDGAKARKARIFLSLSISREDTKLPRRVKEYSSSSSERAQKPPNHRSRVGVVVLVVHVCF
jgi:hypothetical protein